MAATSLPMNKDFTVYTYGTYRQPYRWTNEGVLQPWAGWSAYLSIGLDTSAAVKELTDTNGGIIFVSDGIFEVYLSEADILELAGITGLVFSNSVAKLPYNLSLVDPVGSDPIRFLRGEVYVVVDVPRLV